MQLSTTWLQADFALEPEAEELADRLTMAGLEANPIRPAAAQVVGVVVGAVSAVHPHPNADKLKIAEVTTGTETLHIVCGAANLETGEKVAVARIGATLPGGITIKPAKLRGVDSSGMLCSAHELGMGEDHEGLLLLPQDAPIGADLAAYLGLDDRIIALELTPNRGDAFSMRGLAREIALLFAQKMPPTVAAADAGITAVTADSSATIVIDNQAPADCPKYLARVIDGLDNRVRSPLWLCERLRRAGLRSHNPLVDVGNYVMLLLGTPMHVFDAGKIASDALVIRRAVRGETLPLLDGTCATLDDSVLVIADREQPLALAGVMGGADSACCERTTRVVLESAWFNPLVISGKARLFNCISDSAQRFERGVDDSLQAAALELATRMILDICGGSAGPVVTHVSKEHLATRTPIMLRHAEIARRIGRNYLPATVEAIFTGLGCALERHADSWAITPPSWRFDLAIAADLIEEIVRVDGYHHVPEALPEAPYRRDTPASTAERIAERLCAQGFREIISYSFLSRATHEAFFGDRETLTLCNPISAEMAEMRPSLLPGLVTSLLYNRNRQQTEVRLFELGTVFLPQGEKVIDCIQRPRVAGAMSGLAAPEQWHGSARMIDFFDLKGVVALLFAGVSYSLRRSDAAYLHPGRSAEVLVEARPVARFGALHPRVVQMLGGKGADIWVFEIDQDALPLANTPTFAPIPRFPAIRRDLALLVDRAITADELTQALRAHGGALLREILWFDAFTGAPLPPRKKSLAVALTFQSDEKTLQDEDVEGIIETLVHIVRQDFGAELR